MLSRILKHLDLLKIFFEQFGICSNVGLVSGLISGYIISLNFYGLNNKIMTIEELIITSIISWIFNSIVILIYLSCLKKYKFKSVLLGTLINCLFSVFVTIWVTMFFDLYLFSWLFGGVLGFLTGFLLCKIRSLFYGV